MELNQKFSISTDRSRLDVAVIHDFLRQSYWAKDTSLETVQKSIENSLCFGVYENQQQIGFARVVTDYVAIAYLADVFILEAYRGQGLGKRLVKYILAYPELQHPRKWILATRDAHGLYQKFGFQSPKYPENYMEILQQK